MVLRIFANACQRSVCYACIVVSQQLLSGVAVLSKASHATFSR